MNEEFKDIIYFSVIFNICVALYESITLNHLPVSRYFGIPYFAPTSAYYNENNFSSVLLASSPFFLFEKRTRYKYLANIILICIFLIFCITGNRLALIAFFPMFLIRMIYFSSKWFNSIIIIATIFVLIYISIYQPIINFLLKKVIREQIISFSYESQSQNIGSMEIRKNLLIFNIEKSIESFGFGVGSNNTEKRTSFSETFNTHSINNPHNFFIETLANEGVIGFLCLIAIVFLPFFFKNFRNRNPEGIFIILFFIISSSIPSSIKSNYVYWIYISYSYSFLNLQIKQNNKIPLLHS